MPAPGAAKISSSLSITRTCWDETAIRSFILVAQLVCLFKWKTSWKLDGKSMEILERHQGLNHQSVGLNGLVVWFSLWVREALGSIPSWALDDSFCMAAQLQSPEKLLRSTALNQIFASFSRTDHGADQYFWYFARKCSSMMSQNVRQYLVLEVFWYASSRCSWN
jgi:hypothetical protein